MESLKPITRTENFLAAAAGDPAEDLTPETREEYFLSRLKEKGGGGGESTIAWKPTVSEDGTISWERTNSTTKPADQNIKGPKGDAGPQGPEGPAGAQGPEGERGPKGDTGEKGDEGPEGPKGDTGEKGDAGVSPTVTITTITGGHRLTITDEDHPQGQSFDVMDGESGKVFIAAYGSTTAQDILAYMDAQKEPFAPIIIKRGNDYYTSIFSVKQADNKVLLRCLGSSSGSYYIFNYTITDGTWASNSQGLQNLITNAESRLNTLETEVTDIKNEYWAKISLRPITDEEIDAIIV